MERPRAIRVGFTVALARLATFAALVALAVLAASIGACFGDSGEVQSCTSADDCSTPFLCCTAGAAVDAQGGPHCVIPDPSLSFCTSYFAHLVEGNPCQRVFVETGAASVGAGIDPVPPAVDLCRDGLMCCAATLTCTAPADCGGAPPGGSSSGKACHADGECAGEQICCAISYYDRDGSCASVADCAAASGFGSTAVSSGGG